MQIFIKLLKINKINYFQIPLLTNVDDILQNIDFQLIKN
jgi:hypothetical protein